MNDLPLALSHLLISLVSYRIPLSSSLVCLCKLSYFNYVLAFLRDYHINFYLLKFLSWEIISSSNSCELHFLNKSTLESYYVELDYLDS